jgi:hypothetical protein
MKAVSQKLGEGKWVKTDRSKLREHKYKRSQLVKGQWIFLGVDLGRGKTFLVTIHEQTAEILVSIFKHGYYHKQQQ